MTLMPGAGVMGRPRLSGLLLLVAVLAMDLAVARRALLGGGLEAGVAWEMAAWFGPMTLAMQLGLWRALRSRREARPFWVGFVAGGLLALGWLGLGVLTLSPILMAPVNAYEALPMALLHDVLLGGSAQAKRYLLDRPGLRLAYSSFYLFAPQLVLALAAGFGWRSIARPRV